MSLSKFMPVSVLHKALQANEAVLRVLDCSYSIAPKPDPVKFRRERFAKFVELSKQKSTHKTAFLAQHIPTARFFNLDAAFYPGRTERFAAYEPEVFQEYAQLLGIHRDDHIVLYSRGPIGGMLFSAKAYWLFKIYGHRELSIVNGGLQAWLDAGYETESLSELPDYEPGNWVARDYRHKRITFEELTEKDENEKDVLENVAAYNLIDTRIRGQFENTEDTGLNDFVVPGSRIPGTVNVPAVETVGVDGLLLPEDALRQQLQAVHFDPSKPTVTLCNTGTQAALTSAIIEDLYPKNNVRLYMGSMKEMEIRAPGRISEGAKYPGVK